MRDTVNLIRQGVPAVALVHEPFKLLAGLQAKQLEMPELPFLVYPQDVPSKDPPELVEQKAKELAERVEGALLWN